MATYTQWSAQLKPKKLTWVCGPDVVLRHEVQARIVSEATFDDVRIFDMQHTDPSDLWMGLYRLPLDLGTPILTVVHNAQLITDWEPLYRWLAEVARQDCYAIFFSSEDDFPRSLPKASQKLGDLDPHVKAFQSKGSIVRCLKQSDEDISKWVESKLKGVKSDIASYIVSRSGSDAKRVRDGVSKLLLLPSKSITTKIIDALIPINPTDDFVESLLLGNKTQALLVSIKSEDLLSVVRLLDSRMDLLTAVNSGKTENLSIRDIAEKHGVSDFLIKRYSEVSKQYDRSRRARVKKILAVLEDAVMSGAEDGVVEALVAVW